MVTCGLLIESKIKFERIDLLSNGSRRLAAQNLIDEDFKGLIVKLKVETKSF